MLILYTKSTVVKFLSFFVELFEVLLHLRPFLEDCGRIYEE